MLLPACYNSINLRNINMVFDTEYVQSLEQVITDKLLPVYNLYYELTKLPKPDLDVLIISNLRKKQVPKLFLPK